MGIGAKIKKKRPGTFGIVNAFSMHPLKSLNVMGDGGMVITNNNRIASWMRKYRNHGMVNRDNIAMWGENMRLQPLQAIVALEQLKKIKKIINTRNRNANFLDKNLRDLYPYVKIPKRPNYYKETFALYMCLFIKRNKLMKYLLKNGIETKIHYPKPLHLQQAARNFNYTKGMFPIAEMQSKKTINSTCSSIFVKETIGFPC